MPLVSKHEPPYYESLTPVAQNLAPKRITREVK